MINKIVKNPRLGTVQLEKLTAQKFNEILDYQKPRILLDEAIVKWDLHKHYNAKLTLAGNRTLRLDNLTPGDYGTIKIIQGGAGGYTLTLPTAYTNIVANSGTGVLTLTAAVGAKDIATFYYDGEEINWTLSASFT